jgi:hypothetical protein
MDKAKENMIPDYVGIPEMNQHFQPHSKLLNQGYILDNGQTFSTSPKDCLEEPECLLFNRYRVSVYGDKAAGVWSLPHLVLRLGMS